MSRKRIKPTYKLPKGLSDVPVIDFETRSPDPVDFEVLAFADEKRKASKEISDQMAKLILGAMEKEGLSPLQMGTAIHVGAEEHFKAMRGTKPMSDRAVKIRIQKRAGEFKHVEAYCLMRYKCSVCGSEETVWNSRDGVTPFTIMCPEGCESDGGFPTMMHFDFKGDQFDPEPYLAEGSLVFTDEDPEEYKAVMLQQAREHWGDDDLLELFERFKTPEEYVEYRAGDLKPGEPCVRRVKWERCK